MTLAIVLLVAGLVVGGGIGYFAAPTKTISTSTSITQTVTVAPLKGQIIQIGSIAASDTNLELEKPWHDQTITQAPQDVDQVL